jgi:Mg2+ and Co2+ transporter CorA
MEVNMKSKLLEQLNRCKEWLLEEPDDIEVKNKIKELELEISKINEEEKKNKREEDLKILINLEKEIKGLKREINSKIPIIKGFEEECMALGEINNSIKRVKLKEMMEKVDLYNKLAKEFIVNYGG